MAPDGTTFTAVLGVSSDLDTVELIVRMAVPAGIDGPHDRLRGIATLAHAEAWLWDHGYALVGPWRLSAAIDGLRLTAPLERR